MNNSTTPSAYQTKRQFFTGRLTNGKLSHGQHSYRFEHLLHVSVLNAVYLATDLSNNHKVVVKEVSYRHWRPDERIMAAGSLKHEGEMLRLVEAWQIPAPLYRDCFQWQERLYLVMSFVEGTTLEDLVKQGNMTPAQIVSLIIDLCKVVEALHAHGHVHGDIKPANILVQPNGRVLLVDYGSAQRIRPRGDYQPHGTGTIEFMSIEQIRGEALASNDQFALAKTLNVLVKQPNRHLTSVIARATGPIEQRYHSLVDFKHALRGAYARPQRRKWFDVGQLQSLVPLIAMVVLMVLFVGMIVAPQVQVQVLSRAFMSQPIDLPLQPILGGQAAARRVPPVVLSTSHSAIASPVAASDLLRACYEQYQRSREVAFAALQLEQLECVEHQSPLWNYVAGAIADLQAQGRWRRISQSSTITEITIQPSGEAVIRVDKIDTRLDFPVGCDSPVTGKTCEPAQVVENDHYQVIFYAHLTSTGWRLNNMSVLP